MQQLRKTHVSLSEAMFGRCRLVNTVLVIGLMLLAQACSSGPSGENGLVLEDGGENPLQTIPVLDASSQQARYQVTVRNFWNAEMYPQEFPVDAHFSLFGGALHDDTFAMWRFGETVSAGMEDMAETGRIDMLLEEVAPALANGNVESLIEVREFTGPQVAGVPGELTFEIGISREYPLVSMVSMLGPSPDWFVGVDSQSLLVGDETIATEWAVSLVVPLALFDGGSKSDIIPVMGGPDIFPPNPVALVAYDSATGTYLPSTAEQIAGELVFTRIE